MFSEVTSGRRQPHSCSSRHPGYAPPQVLERILDMQSVVAHCGGLWAAALVITGPSSMPEADRKRIKGSVVKLMHAAVK